MMVPIVKLLNEKQSALISALRTVYFMAKKDIPTHQYRYFLDFLEFQGCKEMMSLNCRKNATYRTHKIAGVMQGVITKVIREGTQALIDDSEVV